MAGNEKLTNQWLYFSFTLSTVLVIYLRVWGNVYYNYIKIKT